MTIYEGNYVLPRLHQIMQILPVFQRLGRELQVSSHEEKEIEQCSYSALR